MSRAFTVAYLLEPVAALAALGRPDQLQIPIPAGIKRVVLVIVGHKDTADPEVPSARGGDATGIEREQQVELAARDRQGLTEVLCDELYIWRSPVLPVSVDQGKNGFTLREEGRYPRISVHEDHVREVEGRGDVDRAAWVEHLRGMESFADELKQACALELQIDVLGLIPFCASLVPFHSRSKSPRQERQPPLLL